MKKKWTFLFILVLAMAAALSLSACKIEAEKLATPQVAVSNSGLASWEAVENASGYRYKINQGEEKTTTATSVQLKDKEKIAVKAVGDGVAYEDSDYSAETAFDDLRIWDGTTSATAPASFVVKDENTFQITDAAAFAYFAATVNNGETYADKTVELTEDIDLNGREWTPIGGAASRDDWSEETQNTVFNGTFDGKNHSVTGLKIVTAPHADSGKDNYYGLFGACYNASFVNLDFVEAKISSADGTLHGDSVAPLVGFAKGTLYIKNCNTDSTSVIEGVDSVSALAGRCYGTSTVIENCTSEATLKALKKAGSVSGIVSSGETQQIIGCVNKGSVEGGATLGGILGMMSGKFGLIKDCVNYGNVTGNATYGNTTGGIVGSAQTATIENCINYGTVCDKKNIAGGICANYNSVSADPVYCIKNCKNFGDVIAEADNGIAGGIAGTSYACIVNCQNGYSPAEIAGNRQTAVTSANESGGISHTQYNHVTDCVNYAEISAFNGAGGISYFFSADGNEIKICKNTVNNGNISVTESKEGSFVGGMFAKIQSSIFEGTAVNNGNINAPKVVGVGGIIGFINACSTGYDKLINNGDVTARSLVGGIVGYHNGNVTYNAETAYTDCQNNKKVTATKGGVTTHHGENGSGTIFTTEESVAEVSAAGGIIGFVRADKVVLDNCTAAKDVAGDGKYVGGLVGMATHPVTAKNCTVNGNLSGFDYVGAFAGGINNAETFQTENSTFTGTISAAANAPHISDDSFAGTLV